LLSDPHPKLLSLVLQLDPHPKLLSLVLQLDPLKLGLCKFNIIINIINITLGSGVAAKPKTLGYSFAEKPNTFRSWPFLIFFMQKKLTRGNARVMQLVYYINVYLCIGKAGVWEGCTEVEVQVQRKRN
jgi:hypothetical protein